MLSIIELNDSKNPELGLAQQEVALRHGLQHMHKAHKANKKHPAVLNMMANHFFLTRDFEKTMRAASRAMKRATNNVSKAEASYQIARAHHQMQEFEKAYKFYRQALDLNADHILAQFGMGQMQLKRGEYTLAIEMFEKLHKSEPECIEVMKVLASLYGISGKKEQSLALFNKILTNTNDDPLMAMEVAEMYEETDEAKALECK
jgi:RNA polymerase-associated protein CTR9